MCLNIKYLPLFMVLLKKLLSLVLSHTLKSQRLDSGLRPTNFKVAPMTSASYNPLLLGVMRTSDLFLTDGLWQRWQSAAPMIVLGYATLILPMDSS